MSDVILSVRDLHVAFGEKRKKFEAVRGVSFDVYAGETFGLVGESGSGKSTIFKIILGLYEPQAGDVTINGEIPLDTSLRGLLAYVPQGNLVLSGSIKENITLFNYDIEDEKIIAAAKAGAR